MIELYVLLTLGIFGYLLNAKNSDVKSMDAQRFSKKGDKNEIPLMSTSTAEDITQRKAVSKFEQSRHPLKTGVISNNFYDEKSELQQEKKKQMIKSLTGDLVDEEEFIHNNMVPYYGGSIKQNMDTKSNRTLLENFTGVNDIQRNKQEVASFYDNTKDLTFINGMKNHDDFYMDRIVAPVVRNNDFPIPQLQVGPGLGLGFTNKADGGFQQFEMQDYVQEKTVDELRTLLNPNKKAIGATDRSKATYESRNVDGMKGKVRADTPNLVKNRVETWYEQDEDMLFKTTGAVLKEGKQGEFNVKGTNRLTTTREEYGTAFAGSSLKRTQEPGVQQTVRQQFGEFGLGTATPGQVGAGTKDDYGKSKILVYGNERDITSTKVYQGNLTSLIKAVVAPLEDIIKITKKQHTVNNPRHFGNMNIQVPNKQTVHDPNNIAKTTIKETLIHDAVMANLRGAEKGTVHDPNDVTRTTLKETLIHDAVMANLRGAEKTTVYDPNDTARTTIKETLIHDEIGSGSVTGPKQIYVYDPDLVAKKTGRETLDKIEHEMNLAGRVYKSKVYDPDDVAKKTTKETTIDIERLFGNINAKDGGGGYETNEYDAKLTQKEFLSDLDYFGSARREDGKGYLTNKHEAKDTQKQFLSDIEYFGGAESGDKKQKSYDDIYNALIREDKEVTLVGREPTNSGNKVFNDCLNVAEPRKKECDFRNVREAENIDRVYNPTPQLDVNTLTRNRDNFDFETNNRFDVSLLKAFKDNPYTQSLNSVA